MYKKFNLEIENKLLENNFGIYKSKGEEYLKSQNKSIEGDLDRYFNNRGTIDGDKIIAEWFPNINVDVFISHSHMDEESAVILAGWLKEEFDLGVFVDSYLWGYSNTLLRKIDNEYCKKNNPNLYDYNKRNTSTSYVHMMLSTALSKMLDNSECIIFLNTNNSISYENMISKTLSPWIYSEIATTNLLRQKVPNRIKSFKNGGQINEDGIMLFTTNLEKFIKLSIEDLINWQNGNKYTKSESLDTLYKLTSK